MNKNIKTQAIMFTRNNHRMFMDCMDVCNWLTIRGQLDLAKELEEKADRTSINFDKQIEEAKNNRQRALGPL